MSDQAADLRHLVRQDTRHLRPADKRWPHLVAVSSGQGGVGTTTVAVNLAVALARSGRATVLVDADFLGAGVAGLCRLEEGYNVADVLSGGRSVHEVLVRGPGGIQVLPGARAAPGAADCSPASQEHLLSALRNLGPFAEYIVLDVGSGLGRVVRRFWHAADSVLVVTSPDAAAVMNTYAAVKVLSDGDQAMPIFSLVNLAPDALSAVEVQDRIARACHRFLGMSLRSGGYVPLDAHVGEAAREGWPVILQAPGCEAAGQIERLAEVLTSQCQPISQPHRQLNAQSTGRKGSKSASS